MSELRWGETCERGVRDEVLCVLAIDRLGKEFLSISAILVASTITLVSEKRHSRCYLLLRSIGGSASGSRLFLQNP